jgi:hypothetical protein
MTKRHEDELPPQEIAERTDRALHGLIAMKPEQQKAFIKKRRAAKKAAAPKRRRPSS